MQYRALGSTGIRVSVISFGAGLVPAVMTGVDEDLQLTLVRRAVEAGINWFDTSVTYGRGQSEQNLGAAIVKLGLASKVYVASKVRLMPDQLDEIGGHVRASVAGSLARLGLERITLLQLHNSLAANRGDEPTSITPQDVLRPGGVLDAFERLRAEGLVRHLGLTGIGQPDALRRVIRCGASETIQTPYNLLNPSAGQVMPEDFREANYGNLIAECARRQMGVFSIRVFAGGALAGSPPSKHTHQTKFFPLDLYHRDQQRAARLQGLLGEELDVKEAAVRFVLSHRDVTSLIIGFGSPDHGRIAGASRVRATLVLQQDFCYWSFLAIGAYWILRWPWP